MRTVAHCVSPYLFTNGQWIYAQMTGLQRYRPVVLTQQAQNLDAFPLETVHDASRRGLVPRLLNRAYRKITGEYAFYQPLLQRERACLIHAHFGFEGSRCLGAQRRSRLPLLTTFYGADASSYAGHPYWRRRYRQLFDAGAGFIVEGGAMAQRLAAIGCPPEKIRVCHLGVDLDRIPFRPRGRPAAVRFLICAGFREKKGIPYALAALGRIATQGDPPFAVTLIGDGPERPAVEAAIAEHGLQDRVEALGALPYAQVLEQLGRCDVLLQPSVTAADGDTEGGAPVILLDAQAAGIPVVATHHADIPEYVVDGATGLLAPERDVEALADRIRLILAWDSARWEQTGRAGRRHVEANYNAERQRAALEDLYDEFA